MHSFNFSKNKYKYNIEVVLLTYEVAVVYPALLQLWIIPPVELGRHRRLDPMGRIENWARLGIRGWRCPPGWTGADRRAGIGDRWRQRWNIHQPRHRTIERRCRVAARLMMTGCWRIAIVVVAVVVAGAVAATVIATGIIPTCAITINSPAVTVVIIIVAVGKALEKRCRCRRSRRRRSMMDDVLNTRGVRKGILRGVRGRSLEKM